MEKLSAVLDGANAPQHAQGAVGRIALLAQRHPDNIHLNTFDLQHFLSLSDDEQEVALTHTLSFSLPHARARALTHARTHLRVRVRARAHTRTQSGSGCLSLSL